MRGTASKASLGRRAFTLWCQLFLSLHYHFPSSWHRELQCIQFCSVNKSRKCQMEVNKKKKRFQQLVTSVSLLLKKAESKSASWRPVPGHIVILILPARSESGKAVIPSQPQASISSKLSHWDDTILLISSGFQTRTSAKEPRAWWPLQSHLPLVRYSVWLVTSKRKGRMCDLRVW